MNRSCTLRLLTYLIGSSLAFARGLVVLDPIAHAVTMSDAGSHLVLRPNYDGHCYFDRVFVRGREVIAPDTGVCSAVKVCGQWTMTRAGITTPTVIVNGSKVLRDSPWATTNSPARWTSRGCRPSRTIMTRGFRFQPRRKEAGITCPTHRGSHWKDFPKPARIWLN